MFAEERTRPVLAEVCRILGHSADNAILLRHHTNAVYAVDDVIIKIAPPTIPVGRLQRVVELVEWLVARDFPTVALAPGPPQPLQVDGHAVTVWQRLDSAITQPITTGELGQLLQRLHALAVPPMLLSRLDPISGIHHSIIVSPILTSADRDLLTRCLDDLADVWTEAMPLGSGLIQSDPQVRNALRRPDGTAVLADWDGACFGPRMWDVATVAVHCRRFSNDDDFTNFVHAYGQDPRGWGRFEDLCRLRELQMISTNARKSPPRSSAAAEVHRRIAGLRQDQQELTAWSIL
ncbi:phosphotransferase [Actinoplanes sp. NBC_00393]|uniref:phosphotransferase n=1 Tax=Actinoplanes sp. NBC_00393 TaxID=2975953 RepID=UPI002E20C510